MNIRNNTLINEKTYTDFQLFRKLLIKRSKPITMMIWGILCAVVLAMLIYSIVVLNLYYIIGSGIFVFLLYKEINKNILIPKKMFKKNRLTDVNVLYHFQRNCYKILEKGKNEDEIPAVKYAQIVKLYDTPQYFYLFFSKNLVNIVAKDGFEPAELQKFSDLLSDQLGKTYIKCK
ncbi:MAG: YcxB family protein [Christensenellaceae bacterium]|nr:YcxB family protein [Christensenellaceae bacterium]